MKKSISNQETAQAGTVAPRTRRSKRHHVIKEAALARDSGSSTLPPAPAAEPFSGHHVLETFIGRIKLRFEVKGKERRRLWVEGQHELATITLRFERDQNGWLQPAGHGQTFTVFREPTNGYYQGSDPKQRQMLKDLVSSLIAEWVLDESMDGRFPSEQIREILVKEPRPHHHVVQTLLGPIELVVGRAGGCPRFAVTAYFDFKVDYAKFIGTLHRMFELRDNGAIEQVRQHLNTLYVANNAEGRVGRHRGMLEDFVSASMLHWMQMNPEALPMDELRRLKADQAAKKS